MKIVLMEDLGISQEILGGYLRKIRQAGHEMAVYDRNTDTAAQSALAKDADALILANMPLCEEAVRNSSTLKFIDVAFTGVDHIPMEAAKEKKITVSNASGYATQAVAELTVSFMIQLLRNVKQTEERCRTGGTKQGLVGSLLAGKTVGIVGAGTIGRKTAKLCKAFGCRILAFNRSIVRDRTDIDEQVSLEELLEKSDIVSLHCPLTSETKGLINQDTIAKMNPNAVLINTARGAVVDSSALADALKSGKIAGAASDVFETEPPLNREHPLLNCPNMIVTPHIAFASRESMELRADIVFRNLDAWLAGAPVNVV